VLWDFGWISPSSASGRGAQRDLAAPPSAETKGVVGRDIAAWRAPPLCMARALLLRSRRGGA
jgi:hypothetical protein